MDLKCNLMNRDILQKATKPYIGLAGVTVEVAIVVVRTKIENRMKLIKTLVI